MVCLVSPVGSFYNSPSYSRKSGRNLSTSAPLPLARRSDKQDVIEGLPPVGLVVTRFQTKLLFGLQY
jgi:hypothetical protein